MAQLDSRLRGNDESEVAGFVRMRLTVFMFRCEPPAHGGLYEKMRRSAALPCFAATPGLMAVSGNDENGRRNCVLSTCGPLRVASDQKRSSCVFGLADGMKCSNCVLVLAGLMKCRVGKALRLCRNSKIREKRRKNSHFKLIYKFENERLLPLMGLHRALFPTLLIRKLIASQPLYRAHVRRERIPQANRSWVL
jgi:hypothetical protein